ncbi:MAG: hypothetical protein U1C18_00305, partial [Patescibacteria group bacterium]|nr:hypothetical protein [Patescibacteria group bacterium]
MRRLHTVMVLAFFAAFWAADFGLAAAQEAVLPPANVRADQVGFLPHLRVSWDASTTAGEVVYRVYRSTSADSLGSIVRNSETDLEYVDATPAYGTAYYYRVLTLLGGVPSALSEQASASPVVPSPAEVRAEDAQKGGTVNLTWQMADPGAALEFEVYRSTSATRYGSRIASKVSGTSFVDGRVTNGITYYYHVRAIAPSGDASEFASASPVVPGNANPEKPRLSVSTTTYEGRDAVSLSW